MPLWGPQEDAKTYGKMDHCMLIVVQETRIAARKGKKDAIWTLDINVFHKFAKLFYSKEGFANSSISA